MDIAPDYMEPLVAWRVWSIHPAEGEARLRSLVHTDCLWEPGRARGADCQATLSGGLSRPHRAPHPDCVCGIHAFTDRGAAIAALGDTGDDPDGALVVGRVRVWGRVVVCEHGYRAEWAYPDALWVPFVDGDRHAGWRADRTCLALGRYGVPVRALPTDRWGSPVHRPTAPSPVIPNPTGGLE